MRYEDPNTLLRELLGKSIDSIRMVKDVDLASQVVAYTLDMQGKSLVISASEDAEIQTALQEGDGLVSNGESCVELSQLVGMVLVDFWAAKNSQGYLDLCQLQFTDSTASRRMNVQFVGMVLVVDAYIWTCS